MVIVIRVLIPSSSGQGFKADRRAAYEARQHVLIPSSSGQGFKGAQRQKSFPNNILQEGLPENLLREKLSFLSYRNNCCTVAEEVETPNKYSSKSMRGQSRKKMFRALPTPPRKPLRWL